MFAFSCFSIENGDVLRWGLEVINQSVDFIFGLLALLGRDEVFDYCIAVIFDVLCGFENLFSDMGLHLNIIIVWQRLKYDIFAKKDVMRNIEVILSWDWSIACAIWHRVSSIACDSTQEDEDQVESVSSEPVHCINSYESHEHDCYASACWSDTHGFSSDHSLVYFCGVGVEDHKGSCDHEPDDSHEDKE